MTIAREVEKVGKLELLIQEGASRLQNVEWNMLRKESKRSGESKIGEGKGR